MKQTSKPKLELEVAVICVWLHSTILKESSFIMAISVFWIDSQIFLDWIASSKKHAVYVANEKFQQQQKLYNKSMYQHRTTRPIKALMV